MAEWRSLNIVFRIVLFVNKLVTKLSIVSNNIGMANVCSVPLSYIFLRGQGIKIFSLVSKECRDEDFLLPVLKKPKTEEQKNKIRKKRNIDIIMTVNLKKMMKEDMKVLLFYLQPPEFI